MRGIGRVVSVFLVCLSSVYADQLVIGTESEELAGYLEEALENEPEKVLVVFGHRAFGKGDMELAERLYRNALLRNKEYEPAMNALAMLAAYQHDFERARSWFEQTSDGLVCGVAVPLSAAA